MARLADVFIFESKCPVCGSEGAYVGIQDVECANPACRKYVEPDRPSDLQDEPDRGSWHDWPIKNEVFKALQTYGLLKPPTNWDRYHYFLDLIRKEHDITSPISTSNVPHWVKDDRWHIDVESQGITIYQRDLPDHVYTFDAGQDQWSTRNHTVP